MNRGEGINAFDGIVYINLDHERERKKHLEAELKRIGVSKKKTHRIQAHHWSTNHHKGRVLSHIDSLKFARRKKWKNVLILENHCAFSEDPKDIARVVDRFLKHVKNWDVFVLSASLHICQLTRHEKIVRALDVQQPQAYAVNEHFFHPLLACLEEGYKKMKDIPSHFESEDFPLDQEYKQIIVSGQWYMTLEKIISPVSLNNGDFSPVFFDKRH